GPASRTEHCRQTDDGGSVSGAVAGVDVVRRHHAAHELLGGVVHLVRRLGAREQSKRTIRTTCPRPIEPGRSTVECFFPGGGTERRALLVANEWMRESRVSISHVGHLHVSQRSVVTVPPRQARSQPAASLTMRSAGGGPARQWPSSV